MDDGMDIGGHRRTASHLVARGLGWFSLGLGTALLAAPAPLLRLCGLATSPMALMMARIVGAREIGHAANLLGSRRAAPWTWTRVGGDAMDLAALGMAMARRKPRQRPPIAIATAAVAGIAAVDLVTAIAGTRSMSGMHRALRLHSSVTVNRPVSEVYQFWHDFENLPRFMYHLESVHAGDGRGTSHWTAKGPRGKAVQWDAEIVEDRTNEVIAWRSARDSRVPNSGRVLFIPAAGGRGTEVRVELEYEPPARGVGKAVARLYGEDPQQQVRDDLRRFKQVMETGEVVRSDGSPDGLNIRRQVMQRPAQPMPAVRR
jgi:uncharacterized membrane protein